MKKWRLSIILLVTLFVTPAYSFNYVTGTSKLPVPTTPRPAKGTTIVDTSTNVTILRVTDAAAEMPYCDNKSSIPCHMVPQYTYADLMNVNGSYLVLSMNNCLMYLYHGPNSVTPWAFIRQIPYNILGWNGYGCGSQELRWDHADPNVLYFISVPRDSTGASGILPDYRATFNKITISDGGKTLTRSVVHDFKKEYPNATWLYSATEGNNNNTNSRYWAFKIPNIDDSGKATFIVYDKQTDTIIKEWRNAPGAADTIKISDSGAYINIVHQPPDPYWARIYKTSDFPNTYWSAPNAHALWVKDSLGRDVFFAQDNNARPTESYGYQYEGTWTQVLDESCQFGYGGCPNSHPSAANENGWGIVCTYRSSGQVDEKFWLYPDQIFAVQLKPIKEKPIVWRIAFKRNTVPINYWGTMHSPMSHYKGITGGYIFFASDWGLGAGQPAGGNIDTYVAILPPNWAKNLTGVLPSTTTPTTDPTITPTADPKIPPGRSKIKQRVPTKRANISR